MFAKWSTLAADPGVAGINFNPTSMLIPGGNSSIPAFLIHSKRNMTNGAEVTGLFRIQSSRTEQLNPKGESYLQFWSNAYDNPFQWQLGEIRGINNGTNTDQPNGIFNGGLAFFCSGGPDIGSAQYYPREVLRLINGKAGINFRYDPSSSYKEPYGILDINLDAWNNFPKISFGVDSYNPNDPARHNPSLRFYRQTGCAAPPENPCGCTLDRLQSYPWHIEVTVNTNDPEGMWGALNFKTGPVACVGQEAVNTKVAILSNGNVGIGVTNPQQKLVVDGTICAREIRASLGSGGVCGWPDYVFDREYQLMPLEDLENSIRENKRLPEMQSAKEFTMNGVELGMMQIKLLKKIEELTLYVIDVNKQNKKLKAEIEQLKTKINPYK